MHTHKQEKTKATQTYVGGLPSPKTVQITAVFDFDQLEMKSPDLPLEVCLMLGPKNTLPGTATWMATFPLFLEKQISERTLNEKTIPKQKRVLMWSHDTADNPYKKAMLLDASILNSVELKTKNIVLRVHPKEQNNTLKWVYDPVTKKNYWKVVQGRKYLMNVTFDAGSLIAAKVASESWRPIIHIYAKNAAGAVKKWRPFTNFSVDWAPHHERDLSPAEIKEYQVEPARKLHASSPASASNPAKKSQHQKEESKKHSSHSEIYTPSLPSVNEVDKTHYPYLSGSKESPLLKDELVLMKGYSAGNSNTLFGKNDGKQQADVKTDYKQEQKGLKIN